MKNRLNCLLVAVLLLATIIPALPVLAEGEKAVANTFNADDKNPTISTVEDYQNFFNAMVSGAHNNYRGCIITLLENIEFNDTTSENWYTKENVKKLIGSTSDWKDFEGTFDGGNHTMTGVIVEGSFRNGQAALFPFAKNASIKNLTVDGFYVCGTNITLNPVYGNAGIGGLIGVANNNLTLENVTMKNGTVTAIKDAKGALGGMIGAYSDNNAVNTAKITDCTVENVRLEKGESQCAYAGGLIGYVNAGTTNGSVLNFSGSCFQPIGSMSVEATLKAIGMFYYKPGNDASRNSTWYVRNYATGFDQNLEMKGNGQQQTGYDNITYCDHTNDYNQSLIDSGCYGATAIPTVKLEGVQPATDGSNDLRFVGLIKQVDLNLITELGFEITVGDKTIDKDKIQCTKVYTSIIAANETLEAPAGYYYFTFVVTGVDDALTSETVFTYKACATVDGKICTTTAGTYTHSPASAS